jgi:hypothetical protein
MRGSLIEYKEERRFNTGYGKWFKDIVWSCTTDEDERDIVEIGQFGCQGYVDLDTIRGIEVTEVMMVDYGFLITKNMDNHLMLYRDDFGYVRFSTYGIEHVYMFGKPIKYLHNFQRIFLDYTGKLLHPKLSSKPKEEPILSFQKKKTGDEILAELKDLSERTIEQKDFNIDLDVDITPSVEYSENERLKQKIIIKPVAKDIVTETEIDLSI